MKLFMKSIRDGQLQYTCFEGMDEETVRRIMSEIRHTAIESVSADEYNTIVQAAQPS